MKGHLFVDSTFGPPPLQYPFKWGADIVMHSGMFISTTGRHPFSFTYSHVYH